MTPYENSRPKELLKNNNSTQIQEGGQEGKICITVHIVSSQTQVFRLCREVWRALVYLLLQGLHVPPKVHSMTFRNHIWPGSAGGLACFLPSCSLAPTRVPLPVKEESRVRLNLTQKMPFEKSDIDLKTNSCE